MDCNNGLEAKISKEEIRITKMMDLQEIFLYLIEAIVNYRTFREICQLQHPITVQKSTKVTKTYSGQTVPMIGYATIIFSYDPDGQFIFPLTVWTTEMRTQNLIGMDFYQKQVSGIHFDLPGVEIKNPPKSICYGSFHQNKSFPHL